MTVLMNSIRFGIYNYPFFAVLFTLPIFAVSIVRNKAMNLVKIAADYLFLLYMICVTALVLFPLPTPEQAALLHEHNVQAIPFRFVVDIIRESSVDFMNPSTYIRGLFDFAVLQVVFNVLMFVPFGMFLTYICGFSKKKVILLSFAFSFLIELTQLTGIYGIYGGSYRLCDVDDLMTNTFGGYVGYQLTVWVRAYLPELNKFNLRAAGQKHVAAAH